MMDHLNWLHLKEKKLESSHPKQLSYWYLWKHQVKKWTQRNKTASFRDSVNNMKGQKSDLEQKIKIHIQHKLFFSRSGPICLF